MVPCSCKSALTRSTTSAKPAGQIVPPAGQVVAPAEQILAQATSVYEGNREPLPVYEVNWEPLPRMLLHSTSAVRLLECDVLAFVAT